MASGRPSSRSHRSTTVAWSATEEHERAVGSGRPFREQCDGFIAIEGSDLVDMFAVESEGLSARGEDRHGGAAGCDRRHRRACRVDDVLAVVDEDQEAAAPARVDDRLERRHAGLRCHAQPGGDRRDHAVGLDDRGELHHADPVFEVVETTTRRPRRPGGSSRRRPAPVSVTRRCAADQRSPYVDAASAPRRTT